MTRHSAPSRPKFAPKPATDAKSPRLYLEVMRGNPVKMPGRVIKKGKNGRKISVLYVRPTLDQRLDAAAWLADRGWGKAKETIELTGEASPAQRLELLRRLSDEDRAQLRGDPAASARGEGSE